MFRVQLRSNLKDWVVTVLGVVLSDAGRHPLHVGPLLLVLYLVDGVLQPAQPRRAVIILQQIFFMVMEIFFGRSCRWKTLKCFYWTLLFCHRIKRNTCRWRQQLKSSFSCFRTYRRTSSADLILLSNIAMADGKLLKIRLYHFGSSKYQRNICIWQ